MSGHKLLQYQHENRKKTTDFRSCYPAASSRLQEPDSEFPAASISRALPSFQKKKQTAVETAEASSIVHGQDLHDSSRSATTSNSARSRIPTTAPYLSCRIIQPDYNRGENAWAANLLH
ncbi:hypothetical protein Nepgr_016402 [Nepenthes gracilis]|uniref:Uncharacterized protein n=1 Tax=Nepenthes gracilis TaxID=150966 RepID=A0AAD3SQ89_NEPGR|nr:hypothetical protein Nepgr_016402 [Nepenthes gracilis]